MKILKNKLLWGIVSILLGLFIGFVAVPVMQNAATGTVTVLRMASNADVGAQLTKEMLETVSVSKTVAGSAYTDASKVIGQYAVSTLYKGDFITAAKITGTAAADNAFTIATAKGKRLVSISVGSLAASVSGRIQAGDVVSVAAFVSDAVLNEYLNSDKKTVLKYDTQTFIPEMLKYMEVAMVTTTKASDTNVSAKPAADEENTLPATVAFYCTDEQALALAELEKKASIQLVFVARGTDTAKYLNN